MHFTEITGVFCIDRFFFLHIYIIWARRAGFSIWHKWKQVKVTSSGSVGEAFSGRTSSGTFTDRTSPRCECMGASSFTAWRTSCLYGVTYSRASPRLFDGRTSSVIFTDRTIFEVLIYLYLLSQGGALCAYTELLTAESFRLSLITLSFYSLYNIF